MSLLQSSPSRVSRLFSRLLRRSLEANARLVGAALGALVVVALAATAEACPNCPVGKQARADVLSGDFGPTVLAALLPFLVIGAVCMRLESNRIRPRPENYEAEDDTFALDRAPRGTP